MQSRWILIFFSFLFIAGCSSIAPHNHASVPRVSMVTDLGTIIIEVDITHAPITTANFLRYVDEDRYRGAHFYRVVTPTNQPEDSIRIQVIQGGLGWREDSQRLSPIIHETTARTGLLHKDGVISMARAEPGSADSEIFICVGDQPELDYGGGRNPDGQGFAAFGRVVEGVDVVRLIHDQPEEGQMLVSPVKITSITRVLNRQ